MKKILLDIVIPVYREQENIERALTGIEKCVRTPHRVIAVWQDKADPTVPILQNLQKQYKNLTLLQCKEGVGVVKALKAGFAITTSEIVAIMMADLSDDPKDIDKMVKKIAQGYDLVCASRYTQKGNRLGGPRLKGFLSRIGCLTLRLLSGIPTSDATNAFKCFRRKIFNVITIESIGGFELPLELTVKTYVKGMRITEVPTIWHEREKGSSKFKLLQWFPQYLRWYTYVIFSRKSIGRFIPGISHAKAN
jgi:dolichol-phosphate mannosyltransferase